MLSPRRTMLENEMFWCKMMNRLTLWLGMFLLFLIASASAQNNHTAETVALINRAEAAFSKLSSLRAKFIQVSSDGSVSEGHIYLRRPYQLRLDYTNPNSLSIVTSKRVIYINDRIGKQIDVYPISETPFAPMLKEKVQFTSPDFTTGAALESGIISIEMSRDTGDGAGVLTLEFTSDTGRLLRWIITDAIGVTTTVSLQNPVYDSRLENKLFSVPSYEKENGN